VLDNFAIGFVVIAPTFRLQINENLFDQSAIFKRLGTFQVICIQTLNRIDLSPKEFKKSVKRAIEWCIITYHLDDNELITFLLRQLSSSQS
jgi:hypothetical protein